jgi:hypothetical protein
MGIRSRGETNGVFTLMTSEVSIRTHRISSTSKTWGMSDDPGFPLITGDCYRSQDHLFFRYPHDIKVLKPTNFLFITMNPHTICCIYPFLLKADVGNERCSKGKERVLSAGGEGKRVFWGGGCSIPWARHFSSQRLGELWVNIGYVHL